MRKSLAIFLAMVALVATSAFGQMQILSLNNSLIDVNTQPELFNRICRAMGKDATWQNRTQLGRTLLFHYNNALSHDIALSRRWDAVILQEHSRLPRVYPEIFMQTIELWKRAYIAKYGEAPLFVLPMNWALGSSDDFKGDTDQLVKSYLAVYHDIPGIKVVPVGIAYELILDQDGKEALDSMYTDGLHPTPKATYLAACMQYATIFDVSPTTITYVPDGISKDEAAHLRDIAAEAIALWNKRIMGRRS